MVSYNRPNSDPKLVRLRSALSMGVFALFIGWRSLKFVTVRPISPTGAVSVPTKPPEVLEG